MADILTKITQLLAANPSLAGRTLAILSEGAATKVIDSFIKLSRELKPIRVTYFTDLQLAFNSSSSAVRDLFGSRLPVVLGADTISLSDLDAFLLLASDPDLRSILSGVIETRKKDVTPSDSEPEPNSIVPSPDDPPASTASGDSPVEEPSPVLPIPLPSPEDSESEDLSESDVPSPESDPSDGGTSDGLLQNSDAGSETEALTESD